MYSSEIHLRNIVDQKSRGPLCPNFKLADASYTYAAYRDASYTDALYTDASYTDALYTEYSYTDDGDCDHDYDDDRTETSPYNSFNC